MLSYSETVKNKMVPISLRIKSFKASSNSSPVLALISLYLNLSPLVSHTDP